MTIFNSPTIHPVPQADHTFHLLYPGKYFKIWHDIYGLLCEMLKFKIIQYFGS